MTTMPQIGTTTTARSLLRDDDLLPGEQAAVLRLAAAMKRDRYGHRDLEGPRSVALLFDKPSTRTRTSFAIGVAELGGSPLVMDIRDTQAARGEPVEDMARVLGRQVAAIVWRTFAQDRLRDAAAVAGVPVVNALSDSFHPCQVLADLLTIQEHRRVLAGTTVTFLGDIASNMAHSWLLGGATAGCHVRLAGPDGIEPRHDVLADASKIAAGTGGSVDVVHDPKEGAYGADVLITDTWASMGSPLDRAAGAATAPHHLDGEGGWGAGTSDPFEALRPFALTNELLGVAAPRGLALHCLPAHRGDEIAAEVLDGGHPEIWDAAENRLHVQKALLSFLLSA